MYIKDQMPMPEKKIPIIIVGAGGIVRDAHLPAYTNAGFEVFAIVDPIKGKAQELANKYNIRNVYETVAEAVQHAPEDVIYDVAVMPQYHSGILEALPPASFVIIQKPMGETLDEAKAILEICRNKNHKAAVNFQLRFAPFTIAAKHLIDENVLGELYDMEIRLTTFTPWDIFPLVAVNKRLEILYHSIHYIDLIRSFLGMPKTIVAKTFNHPLKKYSSTRTTIIFDYGKSLRGVINTNHDHDFGATQQESFIKIEGTKGAVKIKMGLLMNYPYGADDAFEYCILSDGQNPKWETANIHGSWFPDAFSNIMTTMMLYKNGDINVLPTSVEDAVHTMQLVESAYVSAEKDGTLLS